MTVPIITGEDIRNDLVTVSNSSVLVSDAKFRREIFLTNIGATTVTLSIGKSPAVAGFGVAIKPGLTYFASFSLGFLPTQEAIYAIGDGVAAANLAVYER